MNRNRDFRALGFLKVASTILAIVVLLVGIVLMISILGSAANLPNSLIALQVLGLGTIADMLITPLRSVLITSAIVLLVIAVVVSMLFYAVARLLSALGGLANRVARLEEAAGIVTQLDDTRAPTAE